MLKVKPRTQSGDVARLRGKGVPSSKKPAGDLYVKFVVKIPAGDEPEVAQAMQALAPFMSDPRGGLKL